MTVLSCTYPFLPILGNHYQSLIYNGHVQPEEQSCTRIPLAHSDTVPVLGSINYKNVLSLFVYLSLLFGKLFVKMTYNIYKSVRIKAGIVLLIIKTDHIYNFNN